MNKKVQIFIILVLIFFITAVVKGSDSEIILKISDPLYPGNIAGLPEAEYPADKKHLEEWKKAKFGLFIHWGIYSALEGLWKGEKISDLGEQIQRHAKISANEYLPVAGKFNPIKFDGQAYARLAKDAGMTYIVLTSRHHDGFSMFESKYTDFDIMDATPYKKDIVRGFADGCKKEGIKLGLYYSNPDWHFNIDPEETEFSVNQSMTPELLEFEKKQLTELLTKYGPIMEIFFDMGKLKPEDSIALAKTVRDNQPACLVSGRVMNNQGDFYTLSDNSEAREVLNLPWEAPSTFKSSPGHTWGWKSWVENPPLDKEVQRCVQKLSRVTSLGGNFLLNIGPKPDGTVSEFQTKALRTIGDWVKKYRGSIFNVNTTPFKRSSWGAATWKGNELYLHIAKWPGKGKLRLPDLMSSVKEVRLFNDQSIKYKFNKIDGGGIVINLPSEPPDKYQTVITVVCDKEVRAKDPIVVQVSPDIIELTSDDKITKNFIHGMAYKSTVQNVKQVWDFKVTNPGKYNVKIITSISAKKKKKKKKKQSKDEGSKSVIIAVGDKIFKTELDMIAGEVELGSVDLKKSSNMKAIVTADITGIEKTEKSSLYIFSLGSLNIEKILLKKK